MPTYSYKCTECGHAFDQVQSISDPALTVCPNCGGKLRKVFGLTGVTFNGAGFYRTDSRSGSGGTAGSGSGSNGDASKSSSGASGSKGANGGSNGGSGGSASSGS